MKVIFSRKGFDSSYGGYPSPILPDNSLLSLPIPSKGDKITYSQVLTDNQVSYYNIMKQLKPKIHHPNIGWRTLLQSDECHLDPDLSRKQFPRRPEWRPLFGQVNQSQTHLVNQDIKQGDLFLFFGWFKLTEKTSDGLIFERNAPNLHLFHGYFQIDSIIIPKNISKIPDWMMYHPHIINEERFSKQTNAIYIAKERLTWNRKLPGAGVFRFDENLVLTKKGKSRSIWSLPSIFREVSISYHSTKSWTKDGCFRSAKIGQEFVIEESEEIANWAKTLINQSVVDTDL